MDNAQVVDNTRDDYVSVENFWRNWRPIIIDMSMVNQDDMILRQIIREINLDGADDSDFLSVEIWIRNMKRGICRCIGW